MTTGFSDNVHVEASRSSARLARPHSIESEVNRRLQGRPDVHIKSLVVRRTPAGVCLEGRIEVEADDFDPCQLLQGIAGLDEVINHLQICCVPAALNSTDTPDCVECPESAEPTP